MSKKTEKRVSSGEEVRNKRPFKISTIIDALAKSAAAGAIVFGAFIANTYQAKMSSINLINQREQAESQLRANMFNNLIGPIAGPYTNGTEIRPERERLLIELLTLNFHEHFEFKPLLKHVDERLTEELSPDQAEKECGSLRSVARRVKDRQIAMLIKEGADPPYNLFIDYVPKSELERNDFTPAEPLDESRDIKAWTSDEICQPIQIMSPDEKWAVSISIVEIDWNKQTVGVSMSLMSKPLDEKERYVSTPKKFTLTWYDFPLTDNTTLADGNRFSLAIHTMYKSQRLLNLKLIWFPKGYFTPRERPIDYRQFLEKLGIEIEKEGKKE